ncbi:MAG: hypothetical protein ACJ74H_16940 [Thermoanaerobaculia bacterium]
MSRGGEDPDQAVRELLQKYEKEEAAVLRAELIAFLQSPECRDELAKIIRKPLEKIVLEALTNEKFQQQLRDSVVASLKPELAKAVQSAAAGALKDMRVTIPEDVQKRMRIDAEEAVRNTLTTSPRTAENLRQVAPRLGADRRIIAAIAFVVVIAGSVALWFGLRRPTEPVDTTDYVNDTTPITSSLPADTTPEPTPPRSSLLDQYRTALSRMGPPDLPSPTDAQIACIEDALNTAETATRLEVARLRTSLNRCAATSSRPAGPSRIIAAVQAQLTEVARTRECSALPAVTIDGRHGNETSRALKTYVACTVPAGVPEALETLGDYAAVGVYFIDKRMRDAGTTSRR